MDRGARWVIVQGGKELDMTERLIHSLSNSFVNIIVLLFSNETGVLIDKFCLFAICEVSKNHRNPKTQSCKWGTKGYSVYLWVYLLAAQ